MYFGICVMLSALVGSGKFQFTNDNVRSTLNYLHHLKLWAIATRSL